MGAKIPLFYDICKREGCFSGKSAKRGGYERRVRRRAGKSGKSGPLRSSGERERADTGARGTSRESRTYGSMGGMMGAWEDGGKERGQERKGRAIQSP